MSLSIIENKVINQLLFSRGHTLKSFKAWTGAWLHVYTPAHTQMDLGERKNARADRSYLPHTTSVKQDAAF